MNKTYYICHLFIRIPNYIYTSSIIYPVCFIPLLNLGNGHGLCHATRGAWEFPSADGLALYFFMASRMHNIQKKARNAMNLNTNNNILTSFSAISNIS